MRECARCGFRVAQPPSETVTRLQAAPSSRDFETVIWPRNLRKCRRWLEFSDKRDRPRHGIKRRRRGNEREGGRKRGAKVGPRARARRGYNAQENVEGGRGNDGNGNYFPFSARNCSTHEVTAFEHCAFRGLIKSLAERSPNKYLPLPGFPGQGETHQRKRGEIENKFDRPTDRPTEEQLSRRVPLPSPIDPIPSPSLIYIFVRVFRRKFSFPSRDLSRCRVILDERKGISEGTAAETAAASGVGYASRNSRLEKRRGTRRSAVDSRGCVTVELH